MESELIRSCLAGGPAAFEPLVRAYEARAFALAEAILGDRDEAADAVQDAFVRAYRSLGRVREGRAFGPWFRAILRNLCLDRLRSPRRRRRRWTEREVDRWAWAEPQGAERLVREERAAAVRAALATLSADHREVLVLKELEGLSYAEISELTGVPAGTVASRLYHARSALRRALVERGFPFEESVA